MKSFIAATKISRAASGLLAINWQITCQIGAVQQGTSVLCWIKIGRISLASIDELIYWCMVYHIHNTS